MQIKFNGKQRRIKIYEDWLLVDNNQNHCEGSNSDVQTSLELEAMFEEGVAREDYRDDDDD